MTPDDHTAEALRLMGLLDGYDASDNAHLPIMALLLHRAQVHATLATVRPTPPDPSAADRLAGIRALVDTWNEEVDGPDAADFIERLRLLLGS